jgi:hypothetical protein|tara:strand:- start:90 stop:326 length:237 start_codon:yes stop_codon:yes gene_type:complete
MKATELIEELQYAISVNGGNDVEVRTAQQPKWAFEYSIEQAITVEVENDDEETEKIVYLGEGSQIGYLPELASSELGW